MGSVKKKACTEKALAIVQKLLENPVQSDYLLSVIGDIRQEHYRDVVEERFLDKSCGYPLCQKQLQNIPKQKYRIILRTNKLFDITERKWFCSDQCYKASKYLESQLLTCPVWITDEPMKPVLLLMLDSKGEAGLEVEFEYLNLRSDCEKLTEKDSHLRRGAGTKPEIMQSKSEGVTQRERHSKTNVHQSALEKLAQHIDELTVKHETKDETEKQENSNKPIHIAKVNQLGLSGSRTMPILATNPQIDLYTDDAELVNVNGDAHSKDNMCRVNEKEKVTECLSVSLQEIHETTNTFDLTNKHFMNAMENNEQQKKFSASGISSSTSKSPCMTNKDSKTKKVKLSLKTTDCNRIKKPTPSYLPLELIERVFKEWITVHTFEFIHFGHAKFRQLINEHGKTDRSVDFDLNEIHADKRYDALKNKMYMQKLCRKLDVDDLMDNQLDIELLVDENELPKHATRVDASCSNQVSYRTLPNRPPPSYDQLLEYSSVQQLQAFYKGDVGVLPIEMECQENNQKLPFKEKGTKKKKTMSNRSAREVVLNPLPLVDSHSQIAVRRKLVIDGLNLVYPNILPAIGLLNQELTTNLRELVNTFRFSANNVTFKPAEWTLIALVILKLLALKDHRTDAAVNSENGKKFFGILLAAFQQQRDYMDSLVDRLLDIDFL